MTVDQASAVPGHLFKREMERELISGWFRAALVQGEFPQHIEAHRALKLLGNFKPQDLAMREHAQIVAAMQAVHAQTGTLSPSLVLDELRDRRAWEAVRLLPDAATYGLAPVAGIPHWVERIREAARARSRVRYLQDEQARVFAGGAA